ncbi:MAG TPA: aminotransferase class I/II-fold pyridoxal phosphate-dependent enzyme [Isosphaeraceae bacterium]|nr:aminotransferase class I/II-fold pyridoxal phosphate-dependent enzyme [Isosphaeraceae bacterium]
MTPIPHGGNPASVRRRLGLGDAPLLDFSASVNPLGPPPAAVAAARAALDRIDRYPESGCPRLTERLAESHGVPADRVIVGAGTTELIGLIGQSLREVLALHVYQDGDPAMPVSHLVEPTYGEYRRASVLNGLRTEAWTRHVLGWSQDFLPEGAAGVFWTGHPNNPTGQAWDRDRLLGLVDATLGLLTVVDESFLPFLPDEAGRSLISAVPGRDNLLVLRSLSKIYAIPGLRIGYAIASPDMVGRLRRYQEPWTVTLPAEAAALAALDDADYLARTVRLIASESARLMDRLWDIPGLRPAWPGRDRPGVGPPSTPNFLLASLTAESAWTSTQAHEALARRGLLVRECSDFRGLEIGAPLTGPDQLVATRGHLRFAVRTPAEDDTLLAALAEVLRGNPGYK